MYCSGNHGNAWEFGLWWNEEVHAYINYPCAGTVYCILGFFYNWRIKWQRKLNFSSESVIVWWYQKKRLSWPELETHSWRKDISTVLIGHLKTLYHSCNRCEQKMWACERVVVSCKRLLLATVEIFVKKVMSLHGPWMKGAGGRLIYLAVEWTTAPRKGLCFIGLVG